MVDVELLRFLEESVSDRRKELFDSILQQRTRHFTVVVENLFQPQNASAVLRTAEVFGLQDVHIIEKDNRYTINPGIVRGANQWLDLHFYRRTQNPSLDCVKALKAKGYRILATTPHKDDINLEDMDISQPAALVFGSEKPGVSDDIINHADGFVKIPMAGFTESLNISVCVGIVLHHLTWKLRALPREKWALSPEEILEKKLEWTIRSLGSGKQMVEHFYAGKK